MTTFNLKNVASLAVTFIIAFENEIHVRAGVTVKIKFLEFKNENARLASGSYCEGVSISVCETYFELCVKLSSTAPNRISGCAYANSQHPYVRSNNVNFQRDNTGISKIITIKRSQWTGYVAFYMKVWDDDPGFDDDIDTFQYARTHAASPNGTHAVVQETIYGKRMNYRTRLYFSIDVFCDPHYYGAKCDKYCKARDDIQGHYKCSNKGERVCLTNWYNLPDCLTNCVPHDDDIMGHYTCASNGSHVCLANWYNLPACKTHCMPQNDSLSGHYECSAAGRKLCHNGWYGDGCTIFCLPRNDDGNGHYNCSDTGARTCHEGWFGPNCTTFCKPSENPVTGFYNCSLTGEKLCALDYYGENCTIFCFVTNASATHYICDKRSGAKVCRTGFTGIFCNASIAMTSSEATPMTYVTYFSIASSKNMIQFSTQVAPSSVSVRRSTVNSRFAVSSSATLSLTVTSVTPTSAQLYPTFTVDAVTSVSAKSTQFIESSPTTTSIASSSNRLSHAVTVIANASSSTRSPNTYIKQSQSYVFSTSSTMPFEQTKSANFSASSRSRISSSFSRATSENFSKSLSSSKTCKSEISTTNTNPSKTSEQTYTVFPTTNSKDHDTKSNEEKSTSSNDSSRISWLFETKEGKTVLIGSLFALVMLIAMVIAVVMFIRSSKGKMTKRKQRDFKHLEEPPEEWKSEDILEKSHINPLYKMPIEVLTGQKKKKGGKLEKFYTKKEETESKSEDGVSALSNLTYHENSDDVILNPLYGIRNHCFSKDETNF